MTTKGHINARLQTIIDYASYVAETEDREPLATEVADEFGLSYSTAKIYVRKLRREGHWPDFETALVKTSEFDRIALEAQALVRAIGWKGRAS